MKQETVAHYDAQYAGFASQLYAEVRRAAFGEDIGQNGWLTRDEQDLFIGWLGLGNGTKLLDVACGSGGPTLRIAQVTGCAVHGLDVHAAAVAAARDRAATSAMSERARFDECDASRALPLPDGDYDGVICIDAVNHLPDRARVFAEWARVLRPGGNLVFTDPIVVTGPLANEEMMIRSSIGFFLFVPPGTDERLLRDAGLEVVEVVDRTENMARMTDSWLRARAEREADLRRIEGDDTFDGQQRFFTTAARLAAERRLSRFAFHARRPHAMG